MSSLTANSLTIKPGSHNSDIEKSVCENLYSRISRRETLQNKNITTKIPSANNSAKKKTNSKISDSNKIDEKESDDKNIGDRNLT